MQRKKIAFCLRDMKIGGVETVLMRMLDALCATDEFDIVLITYVKLCEPMVVDWLRKHPEIQVRTLYPCRYLGTHLVHFLPVKLIQHFVRDIYRGVRRMFVVPRILRDIDVLVDFYDFNFAPEFRHARVPKIAWWHSSITKFINGNYARYLGEYDRFIVLADGFAESFREKWPQYKHILQNIYNPVDVRGIRQMARRAPVPSIKDYFCCVARMSADKDIATVINAFNIFWKKNRRPNVHMVFVGDGLLLNKFKQMAAATPAADKFVFVGALTNPFGYMKNARAHILSSHSEGMAVVLVESAAVGTLNIASDCANGPREILMNGDAGMLFAPGDADGLAKYMTNAWRKPAAAQKMISCATRNLKRFDISTIMPRVLSILRD